MSMIEPVATIVINKPPGDVFRFVAQVENNPRWIRGAHVVNVSQGSLREGSLFQQDHIVVKVSHFRVNHGFQTESIRIRFPTRLVLQHTHGLVKFEPAGQGTQVTLKEHLALTPFMKPFASVLARKAQQEMQAALEHLKTLLESMEAELY